jgi:hypothetical protein
MSKDPRQGPSLTVWIVFGVIATAVVFGIGWWMQRPAATPPAAPVAQPKPPAVDPFAVAASGPKVVGQSGFSLGPAPAPLTAPVPAAAAPAASQPK